MAGKKKPTPVVYEFLSIYIPPDLKQWVREQSARQGVSISKWVVGVLKAARAKTK